MKRDKSIQPQLFLFAAAFLWFCLWCILTYVMPAFPVDETRYLTVAWEMRQSGNWLLPTLNGAPYSHKPPLLMWLVNLAWSATGGPQIWSARIVALAASLGTFFLTFDLARRLFPDQPRIRIAAPLLLMSWPFFMLYGNLIMFDFMLAASTLASLAAAWEAYKTRAFKPWIYFGLAMGFGVLAKGPVVLVDILLPVILFPALCRKEKNFPSLRFWYGGVLAGVLIATAMGLAWAIPAAITGGPEFAHMIFWEQSVGRIGKHAFAHRREWWFYLIILPPFVLPLLFWPLFWRTVMSARTLPRSPALLFLLSWIVPVFLIFTLMGSKQPHYLIPLLPGLAILIALMLEHAIGKKPMVRTWQGLLSLLPYGMAFAFMLVAPHIPASARKDNLIVHEILNSFTVFWPLAGLILTAAIFFVLGRFMHDRALAQIMAMICALNLFMSTLAVQMHPRVFDLFDLRPLAETLQPYKDKPLAVIPKYAGEIGFLARLDHPVDVLERPGLDPWLKAHPDGHVIVRYRPHEEPSGHKILFTQPYQADQLYSLIGQ